MLSLAFTTPLGNHFFPPPEPDLSVMKLNIKSWTIYLFLITDSVFQLTKLTSVGDMKHLDPPQGTGLLLIPGRSPVAHLHSSMQDPQFGFWAVTMQAKSYSLTGTESQFWYSPNFDFWITQQHSAVGVEECFLIGKHWEWTSPHCIAAVSQNKL